MEESYKEDNRRKLAPEGILVIVVERLKLQAWSILVRNEDVPDFIPSLPNEVSSLWIITRMEGSESYRILVFNCIESKWEKMSTIRISEEEIEGLITR